MTPRLAFADDRSEPSTSEVRAALERILASRCFQQAGRASHFLRFVVEQTLAGGGQRLKGYTIGVEVFGRPADFDAQSDALVRVEAGRLRRRLVEYYASEGAERSRADRVAARQLCRRVPLRACHRRATCVPAPATGAVPERGTAELVPWRRSRSASARAARRAVGVIAWQQSALREATRSARGARGAAANGVAAHRRRAVRESERGRRARCVRRQHDRGDHAAARRARSVRHREPGELVRPERRDRASTRQRRAATC